MEVALMVGLCVLEVCAARDSPLTNTVRQGLHDISVAERWTSRDHDLSKTAGRRSALQNLGLVRPEHTVFFHPFTHCLLVQPVGSKKRCPLEMRMLLSNVHLTLRLKNFSRATLDTLWRARNDLCMRSLVQPQRHLPIYRSIFVYTSSRVVFEALDQRCDGHRGLPHAVLTSEKCSSCLFSETVGGSFREDFGQIPHSIFVPEKFGNYVRNWLVQLKMTSGLTNWVTNTLRNLSSSRKWSNLSRTSTLLQSC